MHLSGPTPLEKLTDSWACFNSLDSGILLNSPICSEQPCTPVEYLCGPTTVGTTLTLPRAGTLGSGKDLVAMCAMCSVHSLVRSGSWAQLRNAQTTEDTDRKDKNQPDAKKKRKRRSESYLGSSFEVGTLTVTPTGSKIDNKSLGKRKTNILGSLGLPSTMRLLSSCNRSTASSVVVANGFGKCLSVDSGQWILACRHSGSQMSATSSL